MNLTPWGANVVIEAEPDEVATTSGILLPETRVSENYRFGIVRSVGNGTRSLETGERIQPQVQVGDRVVFNDYHIDKTFHTIVEEPRTIICSENHILLTIKDGTE